MEELCELVRQYVAGEIDYSAFRRDMVVRFLSTRNADPAVEKIAMDIGDVCADFSEGFLAPEERLKKYLSDLVERTGKLREVYTLTSTIFFSKPIVFEGASIVSASELDVRWLEQGQWLFAATADKESSVVFASTELAL